MNEVMHKPYSNVEISLDLERFFEETLSRYFSLDYRFDRYGNCVGVLSLRNVKNPGAPYTASFSIRKDMLLDRNYVRAMVDKAVRVVLYSVNN